VVVLSAIFSSTRPRWKNTNVPFPGTVVQVTGLCSRVLDGTNLAIDIENVVLNVPTSPNTAVSSSDTAEEQTSSKKRKFSAIASTSSHRLQKFVLYFFYFFKKISYLKSAPPSCKDLQKRNPVMILLACNPKKSALFFLPHLRHLKIFVVNRAYSYSAMLEK
jgi:hypothetical protein